MIPSVLAPFPPSIPPMNETRFPDSWKRRGQARSALGDADGALSDLARAAELLLASEGEAQRWVSVGWLAG